MFAALFTIIDHHAVDDEAAVVVDDHAVVDVVDDEADIDVNDEVDVVLAAVVVADVVVAVAVAATVIVASVVIATVVVAAVVVVLAAVVVVDDESGGCPELRGPQPAQGRCREGDQDWGQHLLVRHFITYQIKLNINNLPNLIKVYPTKLNNIFLHT